MKNEHVKGKKQKRLPTFSLEFEIQEPLEGDQRQVDQALKLLQHHFIRTMDNSVSDEYKSPLYLSLRAFYPALDIMHELHHLVGEDCGTHLHVECHVKEELKGYLGEVFGPLVNHLLTHPHESLLFWGRGLNHYARPHMKDRYFLFNTLSSYQTLEFRLPRFRTKDQYVTVVRFARSCTAFLDKQLPLVQQKPSLLAELGQHILTLYLSFLPQQGQPTWFDALTQEQQNALYEAAARFDWNITNL